MRDKRHDIWDTKDMSDRIIGMRDRGFEWKDRRFGIRDMIFEMKETWDRIVTCEHSSKIIRICRQQKPMTRDGNLSSSQGDITQGASGHVILNSRCRKYISMINIISLTWTLLRVLWWCFWSMNCSSWSVQPRDEMVSILGSLNNMYICTIFIFSY